MAQEHPQVQAPESSEVDGTLRVIARAYRDARLEDAMRLCRDLLQKYQSTEGGQVPSVLFYYLFADIIKTALLGLRPCPNDLLHFFSPDAARELREEGQKRPGYVPGPGGMKALIGDLMLSA
jgi:hypothetical protein